MNGHLVLQCLVDMVGESELPARLKQLLPSHQRSVWSCVILMEAYGKVLLEQHRIPAEGRPVSCVCPLIPRQVIESRIPCGY